MPESFILEINMKYQRIVLIRIISIIIVVLAICGIAPSHSPTAAAAGGDWAMVAANPQRTSWVSEEVSGNLQVEWYRPIEAYIPQNSQVIAANGLLYVSTAKGLYALNAANGDLVWRYDTELPLGNSPTVVDGAVYVGGYDRKLHALDASTGQHLWAFTGAKAGYDTNPLVVNGKVFVGNRDGTIYALGAHGTPEQGQLLWKYKTGGPIHLSAAYKDGIVYFASNDMYAYALYANTGALVWKSKKLPGSQYQSYWPVIYGDKVIFAMAHNYRISSEANRLPGITSVKKVDGTPFSSYAGMKQYDLFPGVTGQAKLGTPVTSQAWSHGYPVIDLSTTVSDYLEDNPNPDTYHHKPWRRVFAVLNISDGHEYTYDSDHDGYDEYIPITWWGTNSGNRYPPIVGPDNILYQSTMYECCSDPKGRVMGWNPAVPTYLSVLEGFGAVAEPQALSGGGNLIYRNLCCDRRGDYFSIEQSGPRGIIWSYNLQDDLAPGYDEMWKKLPGLPNYNSWYTGGLDTDNGAYHSHGDQNPIVPHQGRLFVHRSNAIIAFGPGTGPGKRSLITINNIPDTNATLTMPDVANRLETEIQKIIIVGDLRPGYYNNGQFHYRWLADYFDNPGDTLYTLSIAYPYLSSQIQTQLKPYLRNYFNTHFDNEMLATVGWVDANGKPKPARESGDMPPEVEADLVNYPPRQNSISAWLTWSYPPHNFYAMWKYALIFPEDIDTIYILAKSKLVVPMPDHVDSRLTEEPYFLNAYIAGYIGFLKLQNLAGMEQVDSQLHQNVSNELDRLLQMRANIFTKDSPVPGPDRFFVKRLDISRQFIWLVPEVADYLNQHKLVEVQDALSEYEYIAPYWFVSRFESTILENVTALLYDYHTLFQAKAFTLKESPEELTKYLDVPAFERGDLFYIQNLVAVLERADYKGISLSVKPSLRNVASGESAAYTIQVQHTFTTPVTITVPSSYPDLDIQLDGGITVASPGEQRTLTLTDLHPPDFSTPVWHYVPVTVYSDEITKTFDVGLLVNGIATYLPLITAQRSSGF